MIEPPEKSKNDIAKEQHECECFRQAVELSSTRGGQTQKILTYLNGAAFEGRSKNDRPDIVNICTKGKKNPIEVMVGIEHFEVNQLSKKSGKKIKSTGREIENKLWKGYDRGHEELLKKGMVSNENCLHLSFRQVVVRPKTNAIFCAYALFARRRTACRTPCICSLHTRRRTRKLRSAMRRIFLLRIG